MGSKLYAKINQKPGACNIDLTKLQIHILGSEQNVRAREARLEWPIVAYLTEINIS